MLKRKTNQMDEIGEPESSLLPSSNVPPSKQTNKLSPVLFPPESPLTEISADGGAVLCGLGLALQAFIPRTSPSFSSQAFTTIEAAVYSVVTIIRWSLFSFLTWGVVMSSQAWLGSRFEASVFGAQSKQSTSTVGCLEPATAPCSLIIPNSLNHI